MDNGYGRRVAFRRKLDIEIDVHDMFVDNGPSHVENLLRLHSLSEVFSAVLTSICNEFDCDGIQTARIGLTPGASRQ